MAQGKSPRNPLAFASVLYPGRCLAVELAAPCTKRNSSWFRILTELFHPASSSISGPWPMILATTGTYVIS